MGSASLWIGMLLSSIGAGYFVYGKKQANASALIAGILLCILPYAMHNQGLLLFVSAGLMGLPIAIHKYL